MNTSKTTKHGGARPGAGRKAQGEKKKSYAVYLQPTIKEKLVKKYGSLTAAIESLV